MVYKISPTTGPRCSQCSRKLRFPDYVTMAQDGGKVVSLTHLALKLYIYIYIYIALFVEIKSRILGNFQPQGQ